MAPTVSDYVVNRLYGWGVRTIYGYPGDGINGFLGALNRAEGRVQFIQTRHEELAALMACAHAKFGGGVGVCMATSGPGAIHLLNGLYDAKLDHQPVVAIVGQQARTAIGADYQQEVDLLSLFKDVAHEYVHMCSDPAQARQLIDRAFRIARAERTVTCLIFPNDVQELDAVDRPARTHGTTVTGMGYDAPSVLPDRNQIREAARVLNEGARIAILAGAGALQAAEEVLTVADLLGAGVAKALLGKAVLPDDLPFVTGSIGLLGTRPSYDLMMGCDTLLMIGSAFPYSEWLPEEGQARGVQIDLEPRMLSLRFPMEVTLCGDARQTLRLLIPELRRKEDRAWRQLIEQEVSDWWKALESRAKVAARPINPQRVFWELSPRLPERCILTADSGSSTNWWARELKVRPGMMASLSGNLATMGPALPYAFAAKTVHPDRPVVATVGDGAMQMNGINVLITIAERWREWKDPRLIVVVLKNLDLSLVTWEQRVMAGDPKFDASQRLPDFPFSRYAELIGLAGVEIRTPDEIGPGLDCALAADRPVVIEAHVDPEVPPLPPHIKFEQAKHYFFSMSKGDPHAWRAIKQSMKDLTAGAVRKRQEPDDED